MTPSTSLAEAKADHDDQVQRLFRIDGLFEDLDPAPVFRRAGAEYLLQLVTVPFLDPADPAGAPWTVWSLPPEFPAGSSGRSTKPATRTAAG